MLISNFYHYEKRKDFQPATQTFFHLFSLEINNNFINYDSQHWSPSCVGERDLSDRIKQAIPILTYIKIISQSSRFTQNCFSC